MSDRRIGLARIKLENVTTREPGATAYLVLTLFHTKGGTSYYDGSSHVAGYAVDGAVIEEHRDGCESFMLGAHQATMVEGAARFSQKRLDALRAILARPHQRMMGPDQAMVAKLLDVARRACAAHGAETKVPDVFREMAGVPGA